MSTPISERWHRAWIVIKEAIGQFGADKVGRMSAAIAFRTVFAIAPLLVIAVSIAGFVLGGDQEAQAAILNAVTRVAGPQMADVFAGFIESALDSASTAAIVGVLVLLWSSSTLFIELQRDLNQIFEVEMPEIRGFLVGLIQRLIGVLWTAGIGISLTALFAANAATQIAGDTISDWLNLPVPWVGILGFIVSFGFMALMFGLVFQTLTLDRLPWKPVWIGAFFTAIAFALAGWGIGFYFSNFDGPSALGVSGSIVVLLFLANLLALVFLFGAEVTEGYRRLVFASDEGMVPSAAEGPSRPEEDESPPVSLVTLGAFLVGLLIGSNRRR